MDWLSELLTGPLLPTWALLLLVFLLMAVPMGPAEPVVVVTGALVSADVLPLAPAVLTLSGGMLVGDVLAYRAGGLISRKIGKHPRGAQRLERWQHHLEMHPRSRGAAIVGLRFLPGARTPSALAARGSGVGEVQYITLAAIGSLLWAALWVAGGAAVVQAVSPSALAAILATAVLALTATYTARQLFSSPRPATAPAERDRRRGQPTKELRTGDHRSTQYGHC